MIFFGILANTAQIVAFLVEMIPVEQLTKPLGKMAAMGTGAAMFLFYMIGFSLLVAAPNATFKADTSGALKEAASVGGSIVLIILAWLMSAGTIAVAFLWKVEEVDASEVPPVSDDATPPADGAVPPVKDVEDPASGEQAPGVAPSDENSRDCCAQPAQQPVANQE